MGTSSDDDDDFDNDVDGATVFFPSVLAAMQSGYGAGNVFWVRGEKNDALLAQFSLRRALTLAGSPQPG